MSHRFPKHAQASTEVVDLDAVNENFKAYTEEVENKLNEHNFSADAWDRTNMSNDISLRLFASLYNSGESPDRYEDYSGSYPSFPSNSVRVPPTGAWHTIMSKQFDSKGGILWVIGTCQFGLFVPNLELYSGVPGVQFGIRVNGVLIDDSVDGTLDLEIEVIDDEDNMNGSWNPTPGHARFRHPIRVQATPAVPPGNVLVELVASTIRPWDEAAGAEEKFVFNREIIIVEMA
jgi:hypothetical protein